MSAADEAREKLEGVTPGPWRTSGAQERAAEHDRLCPHCGREWHGLAITERMEQMRREYADAQYERYLAGEESEYAASAILDEDYRYAEDDSRVICPGSEFIGPMQPHPLCQCLDCTATRSVLAYIEMFAEASPCWAPRSTELVPVEWLDDVLAAAGLPVTYELRRVESERIATWPNPHLGYASGGLIESVSVSVDRFGIAVRGRIAGQFSGVWEAHHSTTPPELSPESHADDPAISQRENRRRGRQRRTRRQEPPMWAARMDGRRGR